MSDNNITPDSNSTQTMGYTRLWRYTITQWRRIFGLNVSQINEWLFVGGEFKAAQWPDLYSLGIRAVLSLQAEREDEFDEPAPERTLRLPVQDYHPPTIDQLHQAVAFIHQARSDQLPVLVHCHAGVGRASLTAGAYLITQGLSSTEAFGLIKHARPIVTLNRIQHERLVEWERLVQNRHR